MHRGRVTQMRDAVRFLRRSHEHRVLPHGQGRRRADQHRFRGRTARSRSTTLVSESVRRGGACWSRATSSTPATSTRCEACWAERSTGRQGTVGPPQARRCTRTNRSSYTSKRPFPGAAALMLERGVHHVVLTHRNGLAGVVTSLDFVRTFLPAASHAQSMPRPLPSRWLWLVGPPAPARLLAQPKSSDAWVLDGIDIGVVRRHVRQPSRRVTGP